MGAVMISYVHPGWVQHTFMQSLTMAMSHDRRQDTPLIMGMIPVRYRPIGIGHVRNQAAAQFLVSDAEWMWCVDTDMGFRPDALSSLMSSADPVDRPVVGALCYGVVEDGDDGMSGMNIRVFPTLYGWDDQANAFCEWEGDPPKGLVRVAGTGTACLLIHRSAFEKINDGWFDPLIDGSGQIVGEDLSFCWRLMQAGIPVHVNTSVPTNHQKNFWIKENNHGSSH